MAYPIRDQQGLYFLTFTVVEWLDVFTRPLYKDIVMDSLRYCQQHKGLELFAYCLMTNHLHLIARAAEGQELSAIVRDFKKFTARRVFEAILINPQESRRQWLEWTLRKQGEFNPKNTFIQLWQNHSHGIELKTEAVTQQKLEYVHQNPVRAGICYWGEDYVYSSAAWYAGMGEGLAVSLLF
ncbi:transposase [Hymenobacter artigasi]|uniref:REP element-mobilizing transposase RayT n=1 Tax=Hymenobacter artigasi TaxID=2719616 RepID=A0ABX1HED1_9BACT|nr:transposase [Hymenobacter artigasi]NKI88240.1 REP element-mobilizing transposase RayT [Hymenobacter artigasi]